MNLPDGFLELFGRPPRESACECERAGGVMLGQALNLINGPTIAQAIADTGNEIAKLVAAEKNDGKVVEEVFLRVLNRLPTSKEVESGIAAMNAEDDAHQKLKLELAEPRKEAVGEPAGLGKGHGGVLVDAAGGRIEQVGCGRGVQQGSRPGRSSSAASSNATRIR